MMVLPKIVCPKFHDCSEIIAIVPQCQEILLLQILAARCDDENRPGFVH